MSTLISTHENPDDCLYDLFAVSNHFGGLGGGHCMFFLLNFSNADYMLF